MESIVVGHPIHNRNDSAYYFDLLNNLNVGFGLASVYLLSFCGILAFAFLIDDLTGRIQFGARKRAKIWKRVTWAVSKFQRKKLTAIGLFFLFIHLFLWLTRLFLTNNIKTNKVVVDTSQLVCRIVFTQNETI